MNKNDKEVLRQLVDGHEDVLQAKRMAKILHKTERTNGRTLAQCLELVAAKLGARNWFDFRQRKLDEIIRQSASWTGRHTPVIIPDGLTFPPERWWLGDTPKGKLTVDESLVRCHIQVSGHRHHAGRRQFLGHMVGEALRFGYGVTFLCGGDAELTGQIRKIVAFHGRTARHLDFLSSHRSSSNIRDSLVSGTWGLTDMMAGLLGREISEGDATSRPREIAVALGTLIDFLRTKDGEDLSVARMPSLLSWATMMQIGRRDDLPETIRKSLALFSTWGQAEFEQQSAGLQRKLELTNQPENRGLFTPDGIDLSEFGNPKSDDVFLVDLPDFLDMESDDDRLALGRLVTTGVKIGFADALGFGRQLKSDEFMHFDGGKTAKPCGRMVFVVDVPCPRGFAVVPAQARASRGALCFASDLPTLERLNGREEAISEIANCNMKISTGTAIELFLGIGGLPDIRFAIGRPDR